MQTFNRNMALIFKSKYNFTVIPRSQLENNYHVLDPIQELLGKKYRKQTLENPILHRNKIMVPPKRFRQQEDKIITLNKNKECAVVVNERDEFEDLDLVFDQKQIFALRRRQDAYTQSYYMNINDEEIRFTLKDIQIHPIQRWIINAQFQRYIVGRPNILEMPLYFKPTLSNVRLNRGADFEMQLDNITLVSYNSDYPTRIDIDPTNITHQRGYKIGDLQNSLPPGLFLHKKYQSSLNTNILTIGGDREKMVEQELKKQQLMDQVQKGSNLEEDQQVFLKSTIKKKESNKKKKVRSLKKIVQSMQSEIKERLSKIQ